MDDLKGNENRARQEKAGVYNRMTPCESEYRQAARVIGQGALTIGLKVRASVFHTEIYLWKLESRERKLP